MVNEGYFPRGQSMLRRVQGERSVGLTYGQRALMIGALSPLNYIGTSEHTHNRHTPFQRLARTGKAFETVFFGTRAEADLVLERVARMHRRVVGAIKERAGPFPAGTPYSALDPGLMFWTMAVMAESAARMYQLLVGRLDRDELDRFWDDYVRFGELFGMPREAAPASWEEFIDWFDQTLAGEGMHLTEEARYVGRGVALAIPMPMTRAPARRIHNLILVGSLPPRVREIYELPWSRPEEVAFRAAAAGARSGRPLSPRWLARGANAGSFDLVADAEQRLTAAGRPPLPELHGGRWSGTTTAPATRP